MKNLKYSDGSATYVESLEKKIAELENQLGFIASINRAGLGVVTATPMPSKKVEKIWNAIEEQKDDNFHYGWKKCEQYYGFSTHPAKELHLSLQKSKQTGELLAVTYTDDEHRIVEVLWQRPPVKEQDTDCQYCKQGCIRCDARKQLTDEEIANTWDDVRKDATLKSSMKDIQDFARAILRKAQEK